MRDMRRDRQTEAPPLLSQGQSIQYGTWYSPQIRVLARAVIHIAEKMVKLFEIKRIIYDFLDRFNLY